AGAGLRVVVTSGEPVVRRGGPVTLSAYAEKTAPRAAVPGEAGFVVRDAPRAPGQQFPGAGDGSGAFHHTLARAAGDFEYRVEIGGAASDWLRVTVIDAAELAPGTTTEIVPPGYAGALRRAIPGFVDVEATQYGTAELKLKFTRAPAAAFFEWRAD